MPHARLFAVTERVETSLPNLYRIGRAPEPLDFVPYEFCGKNRFDDPLLVHGDYASCFRVLYLGEDRRTCFLEVLQSCRPDLAYLAYLATFPDGDSDPDLPSDEDIVVGARLVSTDFLNRKRVQQMYLDPNTRRADLRSFANREAFRDVFARLLLDHGATDFDLSTVTSNDRALTQAIARWLYEEGYRGIAYISRFDCEYQCIAVFEGASFAPAGESVGISPDDPDLASALRMFGLHLDPAYTGAASIQEG